MFEYEMDGVTRTSRVTIPIKKSYPDHPIPSCSLEHVDMNTAQIFEKRSRIDRVTHNHTSIRGSNTNKTNTAKYKESKVPCINYIKYTSIL